MDTDSASVSVLVRSRDRRGGSLVGRTDAAARLRRIDAASRSRH
ncbi:hypothetical protein BN903_69 [Halorubrum sp. AJ67]|nr:hypothetical protein BN903_69 [Halorubrum sp. AJ67]